MCGCVGVWVQYLETTAKTLLPLLQFSLHEDIRAVAAEVRACASGVRACVVWGACVRGVGCVRAWCGVRACVECGGRVAGCGGLV